MRVRKSWRVVGCECGRVLYIGCGERDSALTWHGIHGDHEGRDSRMSPFHCTKVGMTPAIIPNVDNSSALFLVAGDCVRAIPYQN